MGQLLLSCSVNRQSKTSKDYLYRNSYRDREDKYEVWNEATILICYSKIYNVFENQAKLKEKRKCLTATAR